ncbi:MAG TPA: histidine phosphatase family protein [Pirellulales bacterium]|jgi:probable phosphoglycerate mutase|nr:histidine phosphatase family protein [Pirellulales bacterium]
MAQLILVRPGKTDFDFQARIQGILNIPLSDAGREEAAQTAEKLQPLQAKALYCAPSQAAEETAAIIGQRLELKPKSIDRLQNVNMGRWQGMLVEEVRLKQPKVYKQWQERPETIQPPDGEMLAAAIERATEALVKLARKHRTGTIALVIPEPLASLIQHRIQGTPWSDLWQVSNGGSRIEIMNLDKDAPPQPAPAINGTAVNGKPTNAAAGTVEKNRVDAPAPPAKQAHAPVLVYRGAKFTPQ